MSIYTIFTQWGDGAQRFTSRTRHRNIEIEENIHENVYTQTHTVRRHKLL